jgi:hypothetical protein
MEVLLDAAEESSDYAHGGAQSCNVAWHNTLTTFQEDWFPESKQGHYA